MGKSADAKGAQDWEASPPLCRNCDHFLNGGHYPVMVGGKLRKKPSTCALGNFNTNPHSVCQKWEQKGEKLEGAK